VDLLLKNCPINSVVLSFDEKAKIPVKEYTGHIYTRKNKAKHPSKQKIRGLIEMPAAINVHTGQINHWFFDWKNAFVVIQCFEKLLEKYPEKEVYVIMDNWSAHRAKAVKVWCALHERFHPVFLPSNASWMNMIERVFSHLERDLIHNSNFSTVTEMMNAISQYFQNEPKFVNWAS